MSGNIATAQNGIATFPNLSIDTSGLGYALTAMTSDGSEGASNNFAVTHFLTFVQEPTGVGVGQVMTPPVVVEVIKADGHSVDTNFEGAVTLSINTDASSTSAQLSGNVVQAQNGIATFSNLTIDTAGEGITLKATISDGAQIVSDFFLVGLNLFFPKPPASGVPGQPLKPAFTVQVDAPDGTADTAYTGNVTLAFGTDPTKGVAKLSGNVAPVVNGVATFPNLSISTTGLQYTLTATAPGVGPTTGAAFNVAHVLGFTRQPASGVVGNQLNSVIVSVFQANGVTLDTSYNGNVTLAIGTNASGNANLLGIVTVAAHNGIATFSTLSLDQPGIGYTLTASVPDGARKTGQRLQRRRRYTLKSDSQDRRQPDESDGWHW